MSPQTHEGGAERVTPVSFARPSASGVVVLGLSARNGYYKKKNITAGLQFILATLANGWKVRPFVPEAPSVWTYLALGYSKSEGARTARRKSAELRRLTRNAANGDPRYSDCRWDDLTGGDTNPLFCAAVARMEKAYETNAAFRRDVQEQTRTVLESRGKGSEEGVKVGHRYIIEEFACMTIIQDVLGVEEVVYVYHKPVGIVDRLFEGAPYGLPKVPGASVVVVNAEHQTPFDSTMTEAQE